ncbi:FAD-dependent oxidoreductase [Pseudosulfitobacter sp. SM2401]|uniref:NAD(P)/FAD-dependent oxidoreductase n=1 Tax=Pseudosulfitobacter sp. SM2401 TaxID=3350098 RepID=UPI0036F26B70
MTRIFPDFAYSDGPRAGCWWDDTCGLPDYPEMDSDIDCDVAIVGAGFTGLNAALRLAEAGVDVIVVDAETVGWGASGRNGGFCCLGGGKISDAKLDRRFGKDERLAYRAAEKAAVFHVQNLIDRLQLDVDKHSNGETELAHNPRVFRNLVDTAAAIEENYGVTPDFTSKDKLHDAGLNGPFHGARTTPIGFGLNPRKYIVGLAQAVVNAGGRIFSNSPVLSISGTTILTKRGRATAKNVIVATNGYSSETVPNWLAGRYMPAQSSVLVTRPLSQAEQSEQGWSSAQMAFDSRNLLHYFRLMPDGRFLFGMRGGLRSSPRSEAQSRRKTHHDLKQMFPAWAQIDVTHSWSGMVCVARNLLPYVGPVPEQPGVYTALCYHGNGVAMGSFSGARIADLILHQNERVLPKAMRQPLATFPFGKARRLLMPPVYAGYAVSDL